MKATSTTVLLSETEHRNIPVFFDVWEFLVNEGII